jgi:hypothetical protein
LVFDFWLYEFAKTLIFLWLESAQNSIYASQRPEPEILRAIGNESIQNGTHTLSSKRIDRIIKAARKKKTRR